MDHAWFAGFAPADNPQVAFAVLVEHGGFGGEVAAPVARQLVEAALDSAGSRPGRTSRPGPAKARRSRDERVADLHLAACCWPGSTGRWRR